jgi:hypothetical protein
MNWKYTVQFPKVPEATAEDESPETSVKIAALFRSTLETLRDSTYVHSLGFAAVGAVRTICDDFLTAQNMDDFNNAMDQLYDFADEHEIWVEPWVSQ